jgi:hypothetical protein
VGRLGKPGRPFALSIMTRRFAPTLSDFERRVSEAVSGLRLKSYELAMDAQIIERAWADRDLETLVLLQVLDNRQAEELKALLGVEAQSEPNLAIRSPDD